MRERLTLLVVLAARVIAQVPALEVNGIIHEAGSRLGIPGVEVGLYEINPDEPNSAARKLITSTFTDANGAYSLKPDHTGRFMIEAKRSGFRAAGAYMVILDPRTAVQTFSFPLFRPGSMTGRVVDSDGNALANFPVSIEGAPPGSRNEVVTNSEGYFQTEKLTPGDYIIHIQPPKGEREQLMEYSDDEFKVVDEDVETSYWPGGVPDRQAVLPIPVAGGASANAGTIVVHKTRYYRAHVSLAGECAPNERWTYRIIPRPQEFPYNREQITDCRKDFLLTGLEPGEHSLAVWIGRDFKAWGLAPFVITNKNVEASLRLSPSFSVSGQVRAAEGHTLAELGEVEISLRPDDGLGVASRLTHSNASGAFSFNTVAWERQSLSVQVQDSGVYVKEIRYNGLPVRGPSIPVSPGTRLEILLDTGAASITGKVPENGLVMLVRDGVEISSQLMVAPFQFTIQRWSQDGTFVVSNLPPGTYRALVIPRLLQDRNLADLTQRLARAQAITLKPNEQKSIELK